jgi:hypothetical protein
MLQRLFKRSTAHHCNQLISLNRRAIGSALNAILEGVFNCADVSSWGDPEILGACSKCLPCG